MQPIGLEKLLVHSNESDKVNSLGQSKASLRSVLPAGDLHR